MEANQDMFGPLKETVTLLRAHGVHVEQQKIGALPLLEFLETAPLKWEATVNATFKKKEEIFPLQTAEMEKIKEQVDAFFLSMREFRNRFRKTAPFAFTGTAEDAYGSINGFTKELKVMSTGAAELNELEEVGCVQRVLANAGFLRAGVFHVVVCVRASSSCSSCRFPSTTRPRIRAQSCSC
jgi:dynein heavy chain, axonemal